MRVVGLLGEQTDLIFHNLTPGNNSVTLRGVPLHPEASRRQGRYLWGGKPLWDCKNHRAHRLIVMQAPLFSRVRVGIRDLIHLQ